MLKLNAGLWATVGGAAGAVAGWGIPSLADVATPLTLAGTAAGIAADSRQLLLRSNILPVIRFNRAIVDKLNSDFCYSPLTSWTSTKRARDLVIDRLERTSLIRGDDSRVKVRSALASIERYLATSSCWEGRPHPGSIATLKALGPFVVNNSCHNTAAQAALTVMAEDFGIPLCLHGGFPYGQAQVAAINAGSHADFVIVADANVFFSSQDVMARDFRLLFPCCWQSHKIVSRRKARSYDRSLVWYADGSSAEEQVRLGEEIGSPGSNPEKRPLSIRDISAKISELDYGESIVAWEPITSLNGYEEGNYHIQETSKYKLSSSLYCNRSYLLSQNLLVLNSFVDCFISSWNLGRIYRLATVLRVVLDKEFRNGFHHIRSMS